MTLLEDDVEPISKPTRPPLKAPPVDVDPESIPIGATVRTPQGRLAKVIGHTGKPRGGGQALPYLEKMIDKIMLVDAQGGDSTPYRELVKETAARFDESIDVERFLPPKPPARPPMPTIPGAAPGAPSPIPGAMPGMPMPGGFPAQPPAPIQ